MSMTSLLAITPWPPVSAFILVVVLITAMYLARGTAHYALRALFRFFGNGLRLAARSVSLAEKRLSKRNRDVLIAHGKELQERVIQREFVRVGDTVKKDLAGWPEMHRRLSESVLRIEEDHEKAVDVPPEAPSSWVEAVKAVANIESRHSARDDILAKIHEDMLKAQDRAMDEYRKTSGERHRLLHSIKPTWRKVQETLGRMNETVTSMLKRSDSIDRHMEEHTAMVNREEHAVSVLASSAIVYFFVSALVLGVAIAGAAVNFTLIARPMAEMVGGNNYIGPYRTADIAALVIIMVEVSMGLFLMESLRITRLFPVIGALSDPRRRLMFWVTLAILVMMASIESGLAYMRELLLRDELRTSAVLRGEAADGLSSIIGNHQWITTAAQMGMGFVLPFALIFVAIPLETFVHSMRTVLGVIGLGFLRAVATVLHMLAAGFRQLGNLATWLYDLPLFLPLFLETWMSRHQALSYEEHDEPVIVEEPPQTDRRKFRRQEAQS
jgi:hypothetical protein